MSKALVIVESPAKAETIARYLGDGFVVDSSIGHIRDLATKKELSPELQMEPWAYLGVETENNFSPHYVISEHSEKTVRKLKKALKGASELYLATDEDREGEAIAWHLLEVLKPTVPVKRMVFHEITEKAINEALSNCKEVDANLVQAQETRRILDRLYGFEVSDVTRKTVGSGASAGRVQSPTTRLLVERERERIAFASADYWSLTVLVATSLTAEAFSTRLVSINGRRVADGKDFDDAGQKKSDDLVVLTDVDARHLAERLEGKSFTVESVKSEPYRRRPYAPFTTSTFQQAVSSKLGLSAKVAMGAAQSLYQSGYITYMRTDSTTLSETAVRAARKSIKEKFGDQYLPKAPRSYQSKVHNAQEAHEAIRPAGDFFRDPEEVRRHLDDTLARVYELVWQRTLASQMTDTIGETVRIRLTGQLTGDGGEVDEVVNLGASGTVITHQGFRKAEVDNVDAPELGEDGDSEVERVLPALVVGGRVVASSAEPKGHVTKAPARYTEASLVKRMEELGIGRPSTYAATIDRIFHNEYAWKKGRALHATVKSFATTQLLETHFPDLVAYEFTAAMEDDLDRISNGDLDQASWLKDFYWGIGDELGLHKQVNDRADEIDPQQTCGMFLGRTPEGGDVYARFRKSPYVQRGDDTSNIPPDLPLDQLTVAKAVEYLDTPADRELGIDHETGLPVIVRHGPRNPYVSLGRFPTWPKSSTREGTLLKLPHHLKVLKVAVAYLRILVDPSDDSAVTRALNSPSRGVGKTSLEKATSWAEENGESLLQALGRTTELGIKGPAAAGIDEFLDLQRMFADQSMEKPADTLRSILEKSGYWAEVEESDTSETQIGVLGRLLEVADEFQTAAELVKELDHQETLKQQPKPKTAALFKDTMTFERVTLTDALQLLSLPRVVGVHPDDGVEITVQNGPFGPYLRKGEETRTLTNPKDEEQLFTVTLEECVELLAKPKKYGRAATPPLAEFGKDPVSGETVYLKDGQFGPYVTDGLHNASLQLGDTVEELTAERAYELLAEARLKGPPKKGKGKKKRNPRA